MQNCKAQGPSVTGNDVVKRQLDYPKSISPVTVSTRPSSPRATSMVTAFSIPLCKGEVHLEN